MKSEIGDRVEAEFRFAGSRRNGKAKLIANVVELRRGLDFHGDKQPVNPSVMDHNIMHLIVIFARLEGQREVGRGSRFRSQEQPAV